MPTTTKQHIGTIMRAGMGVEVRPMGQSAQYLPNEGAGRDYFRRFVGESPQTGYGGQPRRPGGGKLTFTGSLLQGGVVEVYAEYITPDPPPPPDVPPITEGLVGYASRLGPFWQDLGKTQPALIEGVDPVRVWETTNGDFVLTSGDPGTLAVGGGVQFPSTPTVYKNMAWVTDDTSSVYVSSSPPAAVPDENVVIADATNELDQWMQPFGSLGVMSVKMGGVDDGTAGDLGLEETRGIIANGSACTWFSGDFLLDTGTLGVGPWDGLQLGFSVSPFHFTGIVRSLLQYDLPHDAGQRAVSVAFLNTANVPAAVVRIVTVCHFEGTGDLAGSGKTDMDAFQAAYPTTPITMAMAPNDFYLGTPAGTVAAQYSAMLRPIDERAMHCHGQSPWITAAGVSVRVVENYQSAFSPNPDGYFEIMSSYTAGEWTTLGTFGRSTFSDNGITAPTTFLAGGYMFTAAARAGLAASGFTRDLSPVPPLLVNQTYTAAGYTNLVARIGTEYAAIEPSSQAFSSGGMLAVPSNGGVAGYTNLGINCGVFNQNLQSARGGDAQAYVAGEHFGSMSTLQTLYDTLVPYCASHNATIEWVRANQITA